MTHTDLVKYGYPLNIAENYIDLFDDYHHNLDIDIDRFKDMNDDQLKAIDEITKRFSNKGRKIFFMRFKELKTGDEIKETTQKWMENNQVPIDEYYFRPVNSRESGDKIKAQIISGISNKYNIIGIYEDSSKIVKSLREMGYTVFQPN